MSSTHDQHVETQWRSYRQDVMPPAVSEGQHRETRLAFWAGANAVFDLIVKRAGELPDAEAERMLEGIQVELGLFGVRARVWADGKGPPP